MLGRVDWWTVTSIFKGCSAFNFRMKQAILPLDCLTRKMKALLSSEKSMNYAYLPADINIRVLLCNFVVEYRSITITLKVRKKFL